MGDASTFDLAPGTNPHVVRQTATGAITLPRKGLHLAKIAIVGHATEPSAIKVTYAAGITAIFPCEADGFEEYYIDWDPGTGVIASGVIDYATDDSPQAWYLTFDDAGYGASIESYRGVTAECEVANTGTAVTVTFTQDAVPVAAWAGMTTGVAAAYSYWTFPVNSGRTVIVPGCDNPASKTGFSQLSPYPELQSSISVTPVVSGAATYAILVVYY